MPKILLDENHIYTVDGRVTKSVTQILAEEGLTKYWNNDPWYLARGKALHKATHLLDMGTLDWNSIDPNIGGFLTAYANFKADTGWKWEFSEKKLFHSTYHYCGCPDRFNEDGLLTDIKIGEGFDLQLEAYAELLRSNGYLPGLEAYMLNLKEDGTYSLKPYKFNRTERGVFLSAAILNKYKGGRNGKTNTNIR